MFPKDLLQKFTSAFSVPVQAYCKEELIFSCAEQNFSPNPAYYFMQPYIFQNHPVCFVISPDYLMSGYIQNPGSNEYLIIGPACPYELSSRQAKNLLKEMGLPSGRLDEMLRWFHYIPRMNAPSFRNMLDFLNAMLYPGSSETPIHVTYKFSYVKLEGPADIFQDLNFTNLSEQEILALIEYGKPKELKEYFDSLPSHSNLHLGTLAPNAIRSIKNMYISSISIASRTALRSGVSYETIISLTDYYIAKVEKLSLFTDIMDLLVTTLQDFAQRVALCRGINTDSPTVSAICRYIEKNLYSKISTRDIAADLSLERTYLCHLFKSETGQTLMSYIQERKVREAKYLLDSTELPLAAISEQLGYSSQQQFQTTFKRITGITPRAYRIRAQ